MTLSFLESLKLNPILAIEQQRERERQRLREDDDRRKKVPSKKDHLPPIPPKLEPLAIDEPSRPTKFHVLSLSTPFP